MALEAFVQDHLVSCFRTLLPERDCYFTYLSCRCIDGSGANLNSTVQAVTAIHATTRRRDDGLWGSDREADRPEWGGGL